MVLRSSGQCRSVLLYLNVMYILWYIITKVLTLKFDNSCCKIQLSPVDAGDVDDHIDHVTAQFVRLHVHGGAVRGDVNLTDHVEQEGLFYPWILDNRRKRRGGGKGGGQGLGGGFKSGSDIFQDNFKPVNVTSCLISVGNKLCVVFHRPSARCGLLTEMKMLRRFSRVGSWGMSFCTTLLKASKMEWS